MRKLIKANGSPVPATSIGDKMNYSVVDDNDDALKRRAHHYYGERGTGVPSEWRRGGPEHSGSG